jgi:hypothetical protein
MKIKQTTTQIEVIGSDGFNDNIKFYNKLSSTGAKQIGFRAVNGSVEISTIDVNGNYLTTLDSEIFANITEPSVASLSLLVETLNGYV